MENLFQKVLEQDRKLRYLEAKRSENLQTLNKRIRELDAERQKKRRSENEESTLRH